MGRWYAALVLCLGLSPLRAQQYGFMQYSVQQGLAQSQVRCMAQDADGYLWFGTLGGVSRFDGRSFINLATREGLPDPQVNAMALDHRDRLWLASGNTLVRIAGDRVAERRVPGNGSARILSLARSNGALFIATDGEGLFLLDEQGLRPAPGYPADTASAVRVLHSLRDGRLLVGTRTGLLEGHDGVYRSVPLPFGGPVAVSALAETANGALWVGTFTDGLARIATDHSKRVYDEEDGLLHSNVRCLWVDEHDRLWVGTKLGLNLVEKGRIRSFTVHQGMPNDNIWCARQDDEGNLWLGTDGAGVLRAAGDDFVTFTVRDGLCSDQVMTLVADAQGDLWAGTYDNGICRLDGMAMVNIFDRLPNNTVWCSARDAQGVLWFGTSNGLARLERGVVKPLPTEAAFAEQRIMALHVDDRGTLWCGMRDGLAAVGPDLRTTLYPAGDDGPGRSIRALVGDAQGALWMGTEQGLVRFHQGVFTRFTMHDGLCDNTVRALHIDDQGRLWAGTPNGLSCLTPEGFRTVRFADDFGSGYITLLVGDKQGRIWAGTNNGIYRFMPAELLADPTAHEHISLNQGIRSLEFNQNAGFVDDRGRLFLGSAGGLVFHDPARALRSDRRKAPPRVRVNRLRWFLMPTAWQGQCDSLDERGLPIGLRIPHRRNHITVDYTGIAFGDPDRLRFRHRLIGIDPAPLPPTDARFASYSNLPHGHYTFEVSAAVGEGPWSDPVTFSFTVLPPFWLTTWFFLLCGTVLAALVIGVQRYRTIRRQRAERTRQLLLRSRMLQLEQQALNANMNRHFVFNALNSIQYSINKQDRETASRHLTSFAKLIRKNLDASQGDTTTLAEELERLELYLKLEQMRFKERLRYSIEVDPGVDTGQVRLPAMMLQPYAENSIWHGILPLDRPGTVRIKVQGSPGSGRVAVVIEDDGVGLEHSRAHKTVTEGDHISRGIEITKGRADVLRRLAITDIRITGPEELRIPGSVRSAGTRVTVDLPISTVPWTTPENLDSAR
jgi:ligand-binding sensor domain-containing protein